jgi:hypothetical protein
MTGFLTTSFWAKPLTTTALGLVAGCVSYAIFDTVSAGLMGLAAPSGLWIIFEIVRAGGLGIMIFDFLASALEIISELG